MPKRTNNVRVILVILILLSVYSLAGSAELKRAVMPKPVYTSLPSGVNTDEIVIKISEGIGQPAIVGNRFQRTGAEWDQLNNLIQTRDKSVALSKRFDFPVEELNAMRAEGIARTGVQLADLSLYHNVRFETSLTPAEKIAKLNEINSLSIVEIAYFPPIPEIATIESPASPNVAPDFQIGQYYLEPAPTGINAYYAWGYPGGKGDNVKVIDIEGNWIQTHEDLHGGIDDFHIAGSKIDDPGWWNHGTAVLGEIAADSNGFGMTGIAFNAELGTVSIGSMSTASALLTCINNSDTGDVFLIELHAAGPDASGEGQDGYVCMEYWQDNFDVILQASSLDRIVVEAAGNGAENFDDMNLYGQLFDTTYRFSGALMVGASSSSHVPASFTNYGNRVDVHGFGTWDVFTLGYGDLYGAGPSDYYTATFAGTSSASPIITGACAVIQSVYIESHGRVIDHNVMRSLLTTYSTPQAPDARHIGPLPDLEGALDEIVGVALFADTTAGWVPLTVNFSGSSGLTVDSWDWTFGDGAIGSGQNAAHTYLNSGYYDVTLEIDADGEIRSLTRNNYVIALADTLNGDSAGAAPGETVKLTISGNNTVPLRLMKLPVEYAGSLNLSFDSINTDGCRTSAFETVELSHADPFNRRVTIKLEASTAGAVNDLPAGDGPLVNVFFTISSGAPVLTSNIIELDGYTDHLPEYQSPQTGLTYNLPAYTGTIATLGCCLGDRGNVDGDLADEVNISDVLYFVDYIFLSPPGPAPVCDVEADVDGSGDLDISDLLYLVDYSFATPPGPAPVSCY